LQREQTKYEAAQWGGDGIHGHEEESFKNA